MRIILVNDDDDGLYLLARAMKQEFPDADTTCFSSGADVLRSLDAGLVDLMITDNRMPLISGIELVRRVRAARWTFPIVMLPALKRRKMRRSAPA